MENKFEAPDAETKKFKNSINIRGLAPILPKLI